MTQFEQGYFRFPTVHKDQVVFICEDDLWKVSLEGGHVRRLSSGRGPISSACFSPNGKWIACNGSEEGLSDVYILSPEGGPLKRLTHLNTVMRVAGWLDNRTIIFQSSHRSVHGRSDAELYTVSVEGGQVQVLEVGPACFVSYAPQRKGLVLGRNNASNSRWKRYRGGTRGELWIDADGSGKFKEIFRELPGNPVAPMWVDQRIYFVSDHDGIGNIYSCNPQGEKLEQETFHREFYVRQTHTDGKTIVYHLGGHIYRFDIATKACNPIDVKWFSSKSQLQRKFFSGYDYLENVALHPQGHSVAMVTRGKVFAMPLWEYAPVQYGVRDGVRYRLVKWLYDGSLVAISDHEVTEEYMVVFKPEPQTKPQKVIKLPPGRVQNVVCSPTSPQVVVTTSRMEMYCVDTQKKTYQKIDACDIKEIKDLVYSPNGEWIAYTKHLNTEQTAIFVAHLATGKVHQVTHPVRYDFSPAFDPQGRFLYFLSARLYNPIADTVQTAFTFNRSIKPYLVTLQKDVQNPFVPRPQSPGQPREEEASAGREEAESEKNESTAKESKAKTKAKKDSLEIDFDGIEDRVVEFPVSEGIYEQIHALPNKVLFSEFGLPAVWENPEDSFDEGILWEYDFEKQELDEVCEDVVWFHLNAPCRTLMYISEKNLRVVEAGVPVPDEMEGSGYHRRSGWVDLSRVTVSVDYPSEWKQMFREAWRLQKEFFWSEDMSGVDWEKVYGRYEKLLSSLGTRSEFSDLIWEMQGELGTSHAYEYGGDYPDSPQYHVGDLGAEFSFDSKHRHYTVDKIYKGDTWRRFEHSPLAEVGNGIEEGDALVAIGGERLSKVATPEKLLVNQAHKDILLTFKKSSKGKEGGGKPFHIIAKPLSSASRLRYREWVKQNMQVVTDATEGGVGYIHIPDMSLTGIAEFNRGFLAQTSKESLIVDVRYNAGGMVSPLILEKLAHRHLGYDVPRWGAPESYPYHTIRGHLVALTNEFAGSDGDMFCHSFKTLGLGTLIGKRTWGGVIGIDSRYRLVDGTTTTQPQYSIWFHNAGWSIENHGVDPDIDVDFPPHDYANQKDPQLEFAIQHVLQKLKDEPVEPLKLGPKPNLGAWSKP